MADYNNPYAFIDADQLDPFTEEQTEQFIDPVELLESMES